MELQFRRRNVYISRPNSACRCIAHPSSISGFLLEISFFVYPLKMSSSTSAVRQFTISAYQGLSKVVLSSACTLDLNFDLRENLDQV